ncbi:hypothetical protein BHE74_00058356, partial [Ensete ventricosum]
VRSYGTCPLTCLMRQAVQEACLSFGYKEHRGLVVPSMVKGAASDDTGAAEALAAMQLCFNVDSIVIARRLVKVRKHYYIPPEYELHVPLLGQRPYDAFPSGFGLLTDALEAGLRLSLHPVIEACLEGWRMSPSHMTPNSWRYLVAFCGNVMGRA